VGTGAFEDWHGQHGFDVRLGWGRAGLARLVEVADVVVIVDVLSFTTCVDVATAADAFVVPWPVDGGEPPAGTVVAGRPGERYSLSPPSLRSLPAGTRLVLPSPNGSTLTLATGRTKTFAACLRNRRAVAGAVARAGGTCALIAAGERWPDGSLRPAIEDFVGAGAVVDLLVAQGRGPSPEAMAARAAFESLAAGGTGWLHDTESGRELVGRGYGGDVDVAAALDVSNTVPLLTDGAYRNAGPEGA